MGKEISYNRRAKHDYFILETVEAGLVLKGTEVKSLRQGRVSLGDAYVMIRGGEAWLQGMHIPPYEQGNRFNQDPLRTRKLLLHKNEIRRLDAKVSQEGLTLVPLRLYFKNGRVKLEVALAKGKKLYDKREDEKRKSMEQAMRRFVD